jgi:hypothetical protein
MKITITAPSVAAAAERFRRMADEGIPAALQQIADETSTPMVYALAADAPGVSGETIRVVEGTGAGGGTTLEFRGAGYLRYVIGDTAPHEIFPKTAKALAWYDAEGNLRFAAHVFDPGTTANPFHERSWEGMRGDVEGIMRRAVEGLLSDVAG